MKKLVLPGLLALAVGGLLLLIAAKSSKAADADDAKPSGTEKSADAAGPTVKRNANGEMVVTLDAATQKRIDLAVTNPGTAGWQPEATGYGRVLDPAPLASAMVDWEIARTSAEASARDYERLKVLAAQDNAPARALAAAQLAADHDRLALAAWKARFAGDWGPGLAGRDDLAEWVRSLAERHDSLVRLVLPASESPTEPPLSATLTVFPDDQQVIPATFIESGLGVDPQTQGRIYLLQVKNQALPTGAAVTGRLSLAGPALTGVVVPAAAVLRHEGRGWIYLQTAGDEFTRHEIPLDRMTTNGWFVNTGLTVTNWVVTDGAQTLLSTELSGGGFNTGTRD